MNRSHTIAAALLAAVLCAPAAAQVADRTVHVQVKDRGSGVGILRPHADGGCFVLVPSHVLRGADGYQGETIELGGPRQMRTAAELETDGFSTDLSVLRVQTPLAEAACPRWPGTDGVSLALRRAAMGRRSASVAGWPSPAGPATWLPVTIDDLDETRFRVRPGAEQSFLKGMSGSLVYVDNRPVGILVTVSDSSGQTTGTALRLDYVERHLDLFFRPMIPPSDAQIALSLFVPGLGQAATRRRPSAVLALGVAAAGSVAAWAYPDDRTVTLTGQTPSGEPYEFTRTERRYPGRRYAWAPWVVVGALSAVESYRYADRHYMPPRARARRRAEGPAAPRIRVRPALDASTDALQVRLAEIRF